MFKRIFPIFLFIVLMAVPTMAVAELQPELRWERKVEHAVYGVDITSDGSRILIGSYGKLIRMFAKNGTELWLYRTENETNSIAISATGGHAALASDKYVYLLDEDGKKQFKNSVQLKVQSVSISSTAKYVVACSWNKIKYFNYWGRKVKEFKTKDIVDVIASSSTGKEIAVVSSNSLYLYNENGTELWVHEFDNKIIDIAITSEGEYIAAGSADGNLYLLNKDGAVLQSYDIGDEVLSVGISSGGDYIIAGSDTGILYSFGKNGSALWSYTIGDKVNSVAISSKGGYVVAGSRNNHFYFFEVPSITPPAIEIIIDAPRENLSGVVKIDAEIDDPDVNVSLLIDRTKVSNKLPYEWDTTKIENGIHTISIEAKDQYGNTGSKRIEIAVNNTVLDKTPPDIKILSPIQGATVSGLVEIRAEIDDPKAEITLTIDGETVSRSLPYLWDTDPVTAGTHFIAIMAIDDAGNQGHEKISVEKPEPILDTDMDGLSDDLEKQLGTDPFHEDTDRDGIIDSRDKDPLRAESNLKRYLLILIAILILAAFMIKRRIIEA